MTTTVFNNTHSQIIKSLSALKQAAYYQLSSRRHCAVMMKRIQINDASAVVMIDMTATHNKLTITVIILSKLMIT